MIKKIARDLGYYIYDDNTFLKNICGFNVHISFETNGEVIGTINVHTKRKPRGTTFNKLGWLEVSTYDIQSTHNEINRVISELLSIETGCNDKNGDKLEVGDTMTVTLEGTIKNYNGVYCFECQNNISLLLEDVCKLGVKK